MNLKIVKFLLLLVLFCSAVFAVTVISTDLHAYLCNGDPVGGGHPYIVDSAGDISLSGDPVGGGHPSSENQI